MKKIINVVLGFFFFALLIGCQNNTDDSDSDVNSTNHIKVGTVEYPLSQGKLTFGNEIAGGNLVLIELFSSTIIMEGSGNLKGDGNYIYFWCVNSNSSEMDVGTYKISSTETYEMHSIYHSAYRLETLDLNDDVGDDSDFVDIANGNVDFKKIGNGVYEVKINFVSDTGVEVTGYYKGALHKFNY